MFVKKIRELITAKSEVKQSNLSKFITQTSSSEKKRIMQKAASEAIRMQRGIYCSH